MATIGGRRWTAIGLSGALWAMIVVAGTPAAPSRAAAPTRDFAAEAAAGRMPTFPDLADAAFDPARKGAFDGFASWARSVPAREEARWVEPCGHADHRGRAFAMIRAIELSPDRTSAGRLWSEAEAAVALGTDRARHAVADGPARPTALGRDLAQRVAVDRAWAQAFATVAHGPAAEEVIAWDSRATLCHVNADDALFIKELVATSGWPKISDHGSAAADDAWTLVGHTSDDAPFQRQVLAAMAPMVATGEIAGKNYAVLFDRVAVAEGRPQRYGTQFSEGPGGCLQPSAIENVAAVGGLRAGAGLDPLAAQADGLSRAYKLPICPLWVHNFAAGATGPQR